MLTQIGIIAAMFEDSGPSWRKPSVQSRSPAGEERWQTKASLPLALDLCERRLDSSASAKARQSQRDRHPSCAVAGEAFSAPLATACGLGPSAKVVPSPA